MEQVTTQAMETIDLQTAISTLIHLAVQFGIKLLTALIIWGVGMWLARRVLRSVNRVMERREVDESLKIFLLSFLNIAVKAFVVIIVLATVGVQMTSIIAVLGAASLAVGMALSGTLQNFAGGIVIMVFKPFRVGDTIETASGKTGVVKRIMIFTTELHTFDNQVVFMPNGALANGEITNLSHGSVRRSDLPVSIAYGDSVDNARKVILAILAKEKRVVNKPEPVVILSSLGDSSVNLTVRFWVKYSDLAATNVDLLEQIYETLPKKKLNFPFPQLDVHVVK